MISFLPKWIYALIAASVIAALARQLTPPGPVRAVTVFVSGVMLLSAMLSPVLRTDLGALSQAAAEYRVTADKLTEDTRAQEKQLLRAYIQQQTEAYIVEKAQRLGVGPIKAEVLADWKGESWVPAEATIIGALSPEGKKALGEALCAELGIPEERQHWHEP